MDDALAVAEHLHLQMARALQEAFEIERAAAEGGPGLGLRRVKLMFEACLILRDANAAATTTCACLEHDRKADLARGGKPMVKVGDFAVATWHHGHAGR